MRTLEETVKPMLSEDHRERLEAELAQLRIRREGLEAILQAWDEGALDFEPSCPQGLLQAQLEAMQAYEAVLRERAEVYEARG